MAYLSLNLMEAVNRKRNTSLRRLGLAIYDQTTRCGGSTRTTTASPVRKASEGSELCLNDAAKTERGARAAVIGAVAGIIPAIGLGCVRVLNSEPPEVAAQLAGNIAFALVYASPYLLALMASRARPPEFVEASWRPSDSSHS